MERWYAVYTKPHHEHRVARKLKRHNIETYVPDIASDSRRRKRKPFFPNYIFVRLDLKATNPRNWIWTPGLRYLVELGGEPMVVAKEVIQHLRRRIKELETTTPHKEAFKPGDSVRVTEGPFQDMEAVFDKSITANQRAQILIKVLGKYHKVKIDTELLEQDK